MTQEQFAFDIEGMIHEAAVEAAPEWTGAPLHFTTPYYSPAELDSDVAPLDHRPRERPCRRQRIRPLHARPTVRTVEAQRQARELTFAWAP